MDEAVVETAKFSRKLRRAHEREQMLEAKRQKVRQAIVDAMAEYHGREISTDLREEMTTKANKVARDAAAKVGIRAPKIIVDRSKKSPVDIEVRIAFPFGGKL